MGIANTALRWVGKLAAIIALISLGITLVLFVAVYAVGLGTLDLPLIGGSLLFIPAGITIAGIIVWILAKVGVRTMGEPEGTSPPTESPGSSEPKKSDSAYQLQQFTTANKYVAIIFGLLVLISVAPTTVLQRFSGTPVYTVVNIVTFAASMLGGTIILLLVTVLFGGAWYGVRAYNAKEGWLAGVAGWGLVTLWGLSTITRSLGGIAIVLGGVGVLRAGFQARGETQWQILDDMSSIDGLEATPITQKEALGGSKGYPDTGDSPTAPGPVADLQREIRTRDLTNPDDLREILDVEPRFIHPREIEDSRLMYWSYLSYTLGGLTLLSLLLVGIDIWGIPSLGYWSVPVSGLYLLHGFGLSHRSSFIQVGGLVWYGIALLIALVTISPLAILLTVVGVYLGWTTTEDIIQPQELIDELQGEPDTEGSPVSQLIGGGVVSGLILGVGFGLVGAAIFAIVTSRVMAIYGVLFLLPPVAAGVGVSIGVGQHGGRLTGLLGAGISIGSIMVAFMFLEWLLPPNVESEPTIYMAIFPFLGIYLAYKIATGTDSSNGETRPSREVDPMDSSETVEDDVQET